jgi:hypothetical protein
MMDNLKRARNRKRGNKPRVDLHITAPVFYSTNKSHKFNLFSVLHHRFDRMSLVVGFKIFHSRDRSCCRMYTTVLALGSTMPRKALENGSRKVNFFLKTTFCLAVKLGHSLYSGDVPS